jgi:hypothetical protein
MVFPASDGRRSRGVANSEILAGFVVSTNQISPNELLQQCEGSNQLQSDGGFDEIDDKRHHVGSWPWAHLDDDLDVVLLAEPWPNRRFRPKAGPLDRSSEDDQKSRRVLRLNEIAEQRGKIVRLIDRPECFQVGIRLLLRSVFTYVPAELPLNLATAHGAGCKAWCVIGKPKSKRRCSCSRGVGRLGVL